jgi:hypothetical protein
MFKYRVHEVAKDFKVPTKIITKILTDYATVPKNHMQVLTTEELDLIFEHMTQHHQLDSIEEVYAVESPPADLPPKEAAGDQKTPDGKPEGKKEPEHKKPSSDKSPGDKAGAPAVKPAVTPGDKKTESRSRRVLNAKSALSTRRAQPSTLINTTNGLTNSSPNAPSALKPAKKNSPRKARAAVRRWLPAPSAVRRSATGCSVSSSKSPRKRPSRSLFPTRSA